MSVAEPAKTGQLDSVPGQRVLDPRVSVGVPVYNGEKYLRLALDSLLAQTFPDFEVIISDNASTDSTNEIALDYARRDHRIRYYRQARNHGGAWNFNHTVELARGEYFKWAAHDDVLAPSFLEQCVAALDSSPRCVLAAPRTVKIDEQGNEQVRVGMRLRTESSSAATRFHDLIRVPHGCYQGSGLIRITALRMTPLIDIYAGSDRVLLARLGLIGEFYEVPEYLFFSRSHSAQSVRSNRYDRMWWFDPTKQGHIALPAWRIFGELVECVCEVPLSSADRARCLFDVLRWPLWNGNGIEMAIDVARAIAMAPRAILGARCAGDKSV